MTNITLQDIQLNPLAFVQLVEAGEVFVVMRGESALAEVRPLLQTEQPRTDQPSRPFGMCAGSFTVPADFDAPLPGDVIREFEGR
jgi:hypothetical protein